MHWISHVRQVWLENATKLRLKYPNSDLQERTCAILPSNACRHYMRYYTLYCATRYYGTASDRGNFYPIYPVGWAHSVCAYLVERIAFYKVKATRIRILHPLYGIKIRPTLFPAE
jgi:hypothetical protein